MAKIPPLILNPDNPVWQQQEEEQNRQYFFARLFFKTDETVEEFYNRMVIEYTTNGKEGFLKYAPYSLHYFRLLCTQHHWLKRRDAFQKYENKKLFSEMDRIDRESKVEIFKLENEAELIIWKKIIEEDENGNLTPAGAEHWAKAGKTTKDSKNRDLNKPKDINKLDSDVDGKIEVSSEKKVEDGFSEEEWEAIQKATSKSTDEFLEENESQLQ